MNDQIDRQLLRNLLGDQLFRFARSIMSDFITGAGSHDPVAEIGVRNDVNRGIWHRLKSTWEAESRIERNRGGTMTHVNRSPPRRKFEKADTCQ
jgi:hypothetical protein